jgi:transcriptional regulator with XRE-family HTH domain
MKLARFKARLTQATIAERCGLGLSAYSLIESGRLVPSEIQLARLRAMFGDRTEALLQPVPSDESAFARTL